MQLEYQYNSICESEWKRKGFYKLLKETFLVVIVERNGEQHRNQQKISMGWIYH